MPDDYTSRHCGMLYKLEDEVDSLAAEKVEDTGKPGTGSRSGVNPS
jgi:hypothetical protein